MPDIKISELSGFRESIGMTHIVVFAVDAGGRQYVATHGETEKHAHEAASAGNNLKKSLSWPDNVCNSKPLERICKNCTYYKPDRGVYCANGWSGDGENGKCLIQPVEVHKTSNSKCSNFEPV